MIRLTKEKLETIDKAYTHGGKFHADDVFSTALLELINPEIEIIRTFKVPEDAELAFDIGGGLYDHHQVDSEIRDNGVPYAAFGLLWRDLGASFLGSEEEADKFDINFVQLLDVTDNTGEPNLLSTAIGSFNPTWDNDNPTCSDDKFRDAVEFAVVILLNYRSRVESKLRAMSIVEDALKKSSDGIVVLDKFAPWQDVLIPADEAKFVVFPSQRGGYNLQVIPVDFGTQDAKIPLSSEWLEPNKLPEGCSFVHKGLFIAAFDTELDAVNAAKQLVVEWLLGTECGVPKDKTSYIYGKFKDRNINIFPFIDNGFAVAELNELVLIMEHGIDISDYANLSYTKPELTQVRLGLDNGVNIRPYTDNPNLNQWQMREIRLGLESGVDVSIYADSKYTSAQMYQIRSGLERGLDVTMYANLELDKNAMERIRLGLERGFDMSDYVKLELSMLNNGNE